MTERDTAVGVFTSRTAAQQAINEIKRVGFTDDQIGVMARDTTGIEGADEKSESYAAEGGAAGLATGAGVGALWGLGIVAGALPPIGPAIAGGTLAVILSSAAVGAAAAGLAGTLIGLGIPKHEAKYYQSELEAGRIEVTVKTDGRYGEARGVLRRFGGYDMSKRTTGETETEAVVEHRSVEVPVASEEVISQRLSTGQRAAAERTAERASAEHDLEER